MSARDTLIGILRQWAERHDAAPQTSEALVAASDAELLREWSVKIREVGTARGWSVWAAAYMDPDVEFVDTGMPSTETIVAALRRLDRVSVLREVDEQFAAMKLPDELKGTFNAGSYADAWRRCRVIVQAMAKEKGSRPEHEPLVVSRYDVAMEPASEEEPVFTVGAVTEDGRPVALCFDPETRRKVAAWLAPGEIAELERLRARFSRGPAQSQDLTQRIAALKTANAQCRAATFVALALALRQETSYDLVTKLEDLGELALTGEPDEIGTLVEQISELASVDEVATRLGGEIPYVPGPNSQDAPEAPAAPDFFQPERTYQRGRWMFQCLAVAPAPHNGQVHAVGYLARQDGTATVHGMSPENWKHDGWTDVTETEAAYPDVSPVAHADAPSRTTGDTAGEDR
ncbi:hypothetical protein [Streptomyces sp. SM1]|uniref:hypothetical protein n=1 Tax=Streptomyces sp. SM1 TaxID=402229 RepID=UPI000CD50160|nr:hypothetical protein [Streptomyces sp. SM1]